jgi:alkylation response protein AidB-like acyl-CoA dehydrogenase
MAANLSAYAYVGLTASAARLVESFGNDTLKNTFMRRMYEGEWTGTMALTEPQAGSSLTDVRTRAKKTDSDHYLVSGSKIFISGGDQDITENVVNMALARIDGAPPGIKGISLFAIPNRRFEGRELVPNDTVAAGLIHKIGWRGLPSIALNLGERGDCHGWLVGEAHRGIAYMFQMMNEARIMVGMNGVATASVAYLEAVDYAKSRPQGRHPGNKNPQAPQVPIVEHADVRRMLLRQKAIVEGGLALLGVASKLSDLSEHAAEESVRRRSFLLLDLLTPIAKTFPAEKGFEANALSIQVHGGYGYSSEYLPEAWLRDQKLNSLHEGTTGIQSLDLLGRKVRQEGGAAIGYLGEEIRDVLGRTRRAGVPATWSDGLESAFSELTRTTDHPRRSATPATPNPCCCTATTTWSSSAPWSSDGCGCCKRQSQRKPLVAARGPPNSTKGSCALRSTGCTPRSRAWPPWPRCVDREMTPTSGCTPIGFDAPGGSLARYAVRKKSQATTMSAAAMRSPIATRLAIPRSAAARTGFGRLGRGRGSTAETSGEARFFVAARERSAVSVRSGGAAAFGRVGALGLAL